MALENNSIASKIRKLLALADGNANEHERKRAMEAAMQLLARHNLTVSEITAAESASLVQEVEANFRLEPWVKSLLHSTCKLFYTSCFVREDWDWVGGRKVAYPVFVGTEENIDVTIDMAVWLLDSIRKESNRYYKSASDRRSFRLGAAGVIADRVNAMVEQEKSVNEKSHTRGTSSSLMVLRNRLQSANDAYLAQLNLRYSKPRTSYVRPDAYANGEAFGEQVHLHKRNPAERPVAGFLETSPCAISKVVD